MNNESKTLSSVIIEAKIIRADGTIEELGEIAKTKPVFKVSKLIKKIIGGNK